MTDYSFEDLAYAHASGFPNSHYIASDAGQDDDGEIQVTLIRRIHAEATD